MDDQIIERILRVWDEHGFTGDDVGGAVEMAQLAVEALQCGATHPDRESLRCTDFPHHQDGPVYHRNTVVGVEWSVCGDGSVHTVHDTLGQLTLTPIPTTTAAAAVGRYHTLPDETEATVECGVKHPKHDVICDAHHHPLNTSRHGNSFFGIHWETPDVQDESGDPSGGTTVRVPTGLVDHAPTDADLAVFRALLPVLVEGRDMLYRVGEAYREQRFRITRAMCQAHERVARRLDSSVELLENLTGDSVTNDLDGD